MFDLSGKVALVTGASRGIGRAIATRLAEQGAMVVAAARADHAEGVADELRAAGWRAEALGLDVTDAAAVEAVPGAIVTRHGRLDIVVSNAGITRDQLLMRMKRADWDAVLATNLTATFVLAQAAMRPMLKQRGGRGRGADGQRGPDQLCRVESRSHRVCQGAGQGSGVARHHGQRDCTGDDRYGHDPRRERTRAGELVGPDSAGPAWIG